MNTWVTNMTAPMRWVWKQQGKPLSPACRQQAAGITSKLMWIYWHLDPDSQWFGNWILLHVTPNTKAGITRAMVHEVMHDTTVVKAKDSTSMMLPSEGDCQIGMCAPGECSCSCANTDCCVCVSKANGPKNSMLRNAHADNMGQLCWAMQQFFLCSP